MKRRNIFKTVFLSLMVALNLVQDAAFVRAEGEEKEIVVSIAALESTYVQVDFGTAIEEIGLPEALNVVVAHTSEEERVEEERSLDVKWQGDYNAMEAGVYALTAAFVEEMEVAEDAVLPTVEVEVLGNTEEEPVLDEPILQDAQPEENQEQALNLEDPEIEEEENFGEVLSNETVEVAKNEEATEDELNEGNPDAELSLQDDGERNRDLGILAYIPNENYMMDWPGYAEYRAFMDAMPSCDEVDGYAMGSAEFEKLLADMEQARVLAKVVEDFVDSMQDRAVLEAAMQERLEAELKEYEEQGYTITEEELQMVKDQYAYEVEMLLEGWANCKNSVVPSVMTEPRENLFAQYQWYMDRTDTTGTAVKSDLAYIGLPDGVNAGLEEPEDFGLGKKGQENFTISVQVDFNGFTNVEGLNDKAVVVSLPKGIRFVSSSFNASSTGEEYAFTPKGDGRQELSIRFPDAFSGKFYQTFLVEQSAQDLINDLKNSKGNLDFTVDVYTGYRTDNQKHILAQEDAEHSAVMTFKADATTPELSVSIEKGNVDDVYRPSFFYRDRGTDATEYWTMYHKTGETLYVVEVHKSVGYLSDDFFVDFHFPGLEENVFKLEYEPYETASFTPEGESQEYYLPVTYDDSIADLLADGNTNLKFAEAADKRAYDGTFEGLSYYSNKSSAETLYGAGTFRFVLSLPAYGNKLYSGDWDKTLYTSGQNIEVQYMNHEAGVQDLAESATPLYFNFQNGDPIVGVHARLDGLQSEVPQYGRISAYEDTDWIRIYDTLVENSNSGNGYAFYDNMMLTLDFEEALSPIELSSLNAGRMYGISYRIYITDAATGALDAIETIVGEEEFDSYVPQTIDGVTETISNGMSVYSWALSGADEKDNTRYVSRIEAFRKEYEYNRVLESYEIGKMKLRARHALLSDSTVDIEDQYQAKIKMTLSATSPEIRFENEFTVGLRHLQDTITILENDDCKNFIMEVNSHNRGSRAFTYSVLKYADTMKYNTNENGEDIAFGEDGYDPIVVELRGDVVTVTDRLESDGQRILGVFGNDGNYYDLSESGIRQEDYVVEMGDSYSSYSDIENERYTSGSNHQLAKNEYWYDTRTVIDLLSIYEKLGIQYAEKLVVALENVNDTNVVPGGDSVTIKYSAGIHKLEPGYLNYDEVIGIENENDATVKLSGSAALYCKYSDYRASQVNGLDHVDTNGNTGDKHGPAVDKEFAATSVCYGSYSTGIEYVDETTQYVNPYGRYDYYSYGFNRTYMETVRFNMDPVKDASVPQIDYSTVTYDLTGTDPKLLALTNCVTLTYPESRNAQAFHVQFEYTLSDGTSVKNEKPLMISSYSDTAVYLIPELFDANQNNAKSVSDVYLTSLKITLPDGINWGNSNGYDLVDHQLPGIGLGLMGTGIPEVYPNDPTVKVGTMAEDSEKGVSYDNLKAQVSVSFGDSLENVLADGTGSYTASGLSKRIGVPRIYAAGFESPISYENQSNVYQNETLDVRTLPALSMADSIESNRTYEHDSTALKKLLKDNGVELKPTFYYVIDDGFAYVPDSFYVTNTWTKQEVDEGVVVRYIDSFEDGKGLLIVSYDQADGSYLHDDGTRTYHFKLRAKYDAQVGQTQPITDAYADVPFNRNLDGSYDTSGQIAIVDTKNTTAGAPYGEVVGNVGKIELNEDGKAEMLKMENSSYKLPSVSVQEKVFTGMLNYVKAYAPAAEDDKSVHSHDILAEENLFGYKTFLTGDANAITNDWTLYLPVPKKGETFSYYNADAQLETSKVSDFSLVYNGVDTSVLDQEGVNYKLYYTTTANPARDGYASMKEAEWFELTDAVDAESVTGILLSVEELAAKQKISLETMFKLETHKENVGEEIAYIMSYVNYRSGVSTFATIVNDRGYSDFEAKEYHLEDMSITGMAWLEADCNSTLNAETDQPYEGASIKVYDENGNEVEQPNEVVTNEEGAYTLLIPHDGKWQLEATVEDGVRLVHKNASNATAVNSVFDRTSKKTDLIEFVSDYRTMSFSLEHMNLGLYVPPVLNVPEIIEIPVGAKNEGDFTVTVENRPDNTVPVITLKDGENEEIANVIDGHDDTAKFNGLKTGTVQGHVSIEDGYGDTVEKDFTIVVYSSVTYDITNRNADTQSTLHGNAPVDDNKYYPSENEETNVAIAKDSTGFSSSGYYFTGWATSEDDAEKGKVTYTSGEKITLGARTDGLKLYAVYNKCKPVLADPPVTKKITGDRPAKSEEFTFELKAVKNDVGLDEMPMPKDAKDAQSMTKTIVGEGSTEFGDIEFTSPGIYEYSITEKNDGKTGYVYDRATIQVIYEVFAKGENLEVTRTIKKNGQVSDDVIFYNVYRKDQPAKPTPTSTPMVNTPTTPKTGTTARRPFTPNTSDTSTVPWLILTVCSLFMAFGMYAVLKTQRD